MLLRDYARIQYHGGCTTRTVATDGSTRGSKVPSSWGCRRRRRRHHDLWAGSTGGWWLMADGWCLVPMVYHTGLPPLPRGAIGKQGLLYCRCAAQACESRWTSLWISASSGLCRLPAARCAQTSRPRRTAQAAYVLTRRCGCLSLSN